MVLKIETDIQKEHGLPPLATIEPGYIKEGERVFYINMRVGDGERNFVLYPYELKAFIDQARAIVDLQDEDWPDERNG